MTRKVHLPNMVQAITILTVLKMFTNGQTTCNQGYGRVVYERLPDQQLQNFDEDKVTDTAPPFRVLEKCQELCLRDRTADNNLVRACGSFDYLPGSRVSSLASTVEYEETVCHLSQHQGTPDGIGQLVLSPNSVHYNEICLSSSRIEKECPFRHYVFERHPRKRLKLPSNDSKEVPALNRTDCEDRCLNEYQFICRSATFDVIARTCILSRYTRRTRSELMEDDPNSEYLENTCLNAERRCEGRLIFVKEKNKRLGGPFEAAIYINISLSECELQCLKADKTFCRAIEYDDQLKRCTILEEDSISQKDDLRVSNGPTHDLYDLVCLDEEELNEYPDNGVTSPLFAESRSPATTAFQRFRNSRLGSEYLTEINGKSLSDCLDECLRQVSFQCRAASYSERFHICRLYKTNMMNGNRIIYDNDYDYYENLMANGGKPDALGQSFNGPPPGVARPPPSLGGNYIWGGGSYPGGYPGAATSNQIPYSSPADIGAAGYYPYGGSTYSTDISPHGVSAGSSASGYYSGAITASPNLGYPPAGAPSVSAGSLPPISASSIAPYPSPFGGYYPPNPGFDNRPFFSGRCDDQDQFRQIGIHKKMKRQFMRRSLTTPTLAACEKECTDASDFVCRSFNYRSTPFGVTRENCELTDRDSRDFDMANANYFDNVGDYDFYERSASGRSGSDCLDVMQTCSEDGMEFTLKTPDGFLGRIYTHGYYDRCFYKGNGGQVNALRISGAQGYPDCGTIRFGDTMTNIVVVQFSEYVQTSRDKRYNLTCLFRGPGESVVTSGYMTANSGSPVPIEYLPGENSLSSKVRLSILYQNRPTNTIAVGDPLTFRLEANEGYNYANDIFATNVVARDPYTGRSVTLIDRYGCPVDNSVFPPLDRAREGDGLEARFQAFKIPESNYLIFEATVRTCREGCTPAYCQTSGPNGRSEQSLGRRKREVDDAGDSSNETEERYSEYLDNANVTDPDEEEVQRMMLKVYDFRDEINPQQLVLKPKPEKQYLMEPLTTVCLTNREYYGMIMVMFIFMTLMVIITVIAGIYYKRYWIVTSKNKTANSTSGILSGFSSHSHSIRLESPQPRYAPSARSLFSLPSLSSGSSERTTSSKIHEDISERKGYAAELETPGVSVVHEECLQSFKETPEPIYTDLSLFERSRSLRSLSFNNESINDR